MTERLVFLASAWGPRHGGINSFNADLARAVAAARSTHSPQVVCVVAETINQAAQLDAQRAGVTLVHADISTAQGWAADDAVATTVKSLRVAGLPSQSSWWIGHDLVTGGAAVALAKNQSGKSALVHHTSYVYYGSVKHGASAGMLEKQQLQKEVFAGADRLLAVGPLLRKRLIDLTNAEPDEVTELIPGLVDVAGFAPPTTEARAIVFGRLEQSDDRVKQARLAINSFAAAVQRAKERNSPLALCGNPRITAVGLTHAEETEIRVKAGQVAAGSLNLIAMPFTEDRGKVLGELGRANLALVPSWYEGFGLAAWEAVGACVPLIVGKNTGVVALLEGIGSGALSGCFRVVDVRGSTDGQSCSSTDLETLAGAITEITANLAEAKGRARFLREQLKGFTWAHTANQLLGALAPKGHAPRILVHSAAPAVKSPVADAGAVCAWGRLPEFATPDMGDLHAANGRSAYAQGEYDLCYRHQVEAARLFASCEQQTDAVLALVEAMSALRPARLGDKLRGVILDVELLCRWYPIGLSARWLFLDRLALVLLDYANFGKAKEVADASERFLRQLKSDPWNPQQHRRDVDNAFRRRALARGLGGGLGSRRAVLHTLDALAELARDFEQLREENSIVTSLDVASKLAKDVLHDAERAHTFSERALARRPRSNHWWALQEHLVREGEYYQSRQAVGPATASFMEALALQQRAPVVLEPSPGAAHRSDVAMVARRAGLEWGELAERGIRPRSVAPIPLGLDDAAIDRVVTTVMM